MQRRSFKRTPVFPCIPTGSAAYLLLLKTLDECNNIYFKYYYFSYKLIRLRLLYCFFSYISFGWYGEKTVIIFVEQNSRKKIWILQWVMMRTFVWLKLNKYLWEEIIVYFFRDTAAHGILAAAVIADNQNEIYRFDDFFFSFRQWYFYFSSSN